MAREDTWIEVNSPHFRVISNASPKQARRTARSFEQFRLLLKTFLPAGHKIDPGTPLIVFATRDGNDMKALLPEERRSQNAAKIGGIFMGNSETHIVVLPLDVPDEMAYHTAYHEFVHMVMHLNYQHLPLWFDEGLAELFAFAKLSDGQSSMGDASPEQILTLQKYNMMPLSVLLTVGRDSPYYLQADKMRVFYAQSWALTHYLILGDKSARIKQVAEFMKLLETGVPGAEAMTRIFGETKALEQSLGKYIRGNDFYHYQVPTRLDVKEEEYTVGTLTQAESLALRGQCLIASGRLEDAKAMLAQALQLDARNADANEGMGLACLRLKDPDLARKHFSEAVQLNSKSFLAYFYAAQSEYEQGTGYETVEKYLRKAIEINPNFAPAYNLLAGTLMRQDNRLPEALEMGIQAVKLEPAELRYRLNVCQILISMKKYEEASRIAAQVLNSADSDGEKELAQSVLSQINTRKEMELEARQREEEHRRQVEEFNARARKIEAARAEHPGEATPIQSAQANTPAPPLKTGPRGQTSGVIKAVLCSDPAILDIVLESNGKQQKFRAENYYNVQFEAIGAPGKTGFEPCVELQGKTVKIEFQSVIGQEFSGLILKCGIMK
jgi:tetratricopeptide (TPR) repeat protein